LSDRKDLDPNYQIRQEIERKRKENKKHLLEVFKIKEEDLENDNIIPGSETE
jgi:hypothetical protein